MGKRQWFAVLLLAGLANSAIAGQAFSPEAVRKTAEASMLVTGAVDVNPDGSLHGYTLDEQDKLPPTVVALIGRTMPHMSFKLSAPVSDVVHVSMSLRLLAKPIGDGNYNVTLASASFGSTRGGDGEWVSSKDRAAPRYPRQAVNAGVSGTAYLLVRVGRDGAVQEVIAEQVNLDQYAAANQMEMFRKWLATSAIEAARQWTFNLPTHGAHVDDPYWVVRVPVNYSLRNHGVLETKPYGSWVSYIPGPRQSPPWVSPSLANEAPDSVPDGALQTGEAPIRLAKPIQGG